MKRKSIQKIRVGCMIELALCFIATVVLCLCRVNSMKYFVPVLLFFSIGIIVKTVLEACKEKEDHLVLWLHIVASCFMAAFTIWGVCHYLAMV